MSAPGAPSGGFGLAGRSVAVLGVADETSIAWAIARAFAAEGAHVTIGYQQRFLSRVRLLLRDHPGIEAERCDVLDDAEVAGFFGRFDERTLDVLVHAIAYGAPATFTREPSDVPLDAFEPTLAVSAHSLARVVQHAKPALRDWSSVLALSFHAAQRAFPMYGTMGVAKAALESLVRYLAAELGARGIRVNAISPGPIETLAALGILLAFVDDDEALGRQRGIVPEAIALARAEGVDESPEAFASRAWKHVQDEFARRSAIDAVVDADDVASAALFLGSDHARKITGQVLHVDCGFSSVMIV